MDLRKRIFALIMSLTMVLTYMPALAFADTDAPAGNEPAVEEDVSEATPAAETPAPAEPAEQEEAAPSDEPAPVQAEADAEAADEEAAPVTEEPAAAPGGKSAPVVQTANPGTDLADSDELLEKFLEIGVSDQTGKGTAANTRKKAARATRGSRLEGSNAAIYQELIPKIKAIAGGTASSSEITFPISLLTGDDLKVTAEELGVQSIDETAEEAISNFMFGFSDPVIDALMADFPYEFYWYDKTSSGGLSMGGPGYYIYPDYIEFDKTDVITLGFNVSADYSKSGETGTCDVDTDKTSAASAFVSNASDLIYNNEDKSDVEKLTAYKDAICDNTAYDDAAAAGGVNYGDPWQMISVFDDNADTNVVCEGYSKAFQFLCDHSTFSNVRIECDSVTGDMVGGTGAGAHMWNILHMDDGKNYIADITNCDAGTIGAPDRLFLTGAASGSVESGYSFVIDANNHVDYTYDDETASLFDASELELSDTDYNASAVIDENQPTAIALTLADEDGVTRELQAYEFADDVLNFPAEGDTITVTFGSGDNETTRDYVFDELEWAFMSDGVNLEDNGTGFELTYDFGRNKNGFSPDENGKDIMTINYGRGSTVLSTDVEVSIKASEITSFEYTQATPLVLYRNPETGELMNLDSYNFVQPGDSMNFYAVDEYGEQYSKVYYAELNPYLGGWQYQLKLVACTEGYDDSPYAYPTLIADTSSWTEPGTYTATVGFEGASKDILVEVRDFPYTKMVFSPVNGGITLKSNPLKTTDEQGETYFEIYKRSPKNQFFIQGDTLSLTDSNGTTVYTFDQRQGDFFDSNGIRLVRGDSLNVFTTAKAKIGYNDARVGYGFLTTDETFNITLEEGGDEPFVINSDGMEIDAFRTPDGFAYTAVNSDGGNGVSIIGYNGGESVLNVPAEISGRPVTGFAIDPYNPVAGDTNYDNITQINFPETMLYARTRNLKRFDNLEKFGDFESAGYFASGDVLYKKYAEDFIEVACYPAARTATEWTVDSRVTESFKATPAMKSLTSLTLSPNADQYLRTLHNMDNIQAVNIPESSTSYASKDGVLYSKDMTELLFYPDKYPQSEFTMPDTVRTIGDEAFDDDCTLRKINLSAAIENVYEGTIDYCKNLQEVAFTGTTVPADPGAFEGIKEAYFEKNIKITYPENVEGYAEFIEKILMAGFEPIPDNPVVLDKSGETTFTIEPGTVTTLKYAPGEKGIYYIDMQTSQDPACEYCFFSSDDHYMRQNGASYAYVLNYDESGNPISYVWTQYLPVEQNDDTMYLQIRLPEGRESLPVTATVRKEQQGIADIPENCGKLVLGQVTEGEVTSADEVVTYEFDTTYYTDSGYTIQLSRAAATAETEPSAQYAVFEKDGIYTLNNEFFSDESIIRTVYGLNEHSSYYIQFRPGIAGPYSIRVTRNAGESEFAEVPESPETIAAGETKQFVIEKSGDTASYVFVPEKTADFVFTTNGDTDTIGRLLDADKKELMINDDDGDSYNFKIAFRGIAGETYYLQARAYGSETGTTEVSLSAKETEHTHTLVKTDAVPATCEDDGTEAYWICSDCGEMFADADGTETIKSPAVIPALGHDWSEWAVTTAPTCTEKGTETRSCSRCDVKENREVAALGHDFQRVLDTYKAATCEEAGKEADEKCSRCGELHEGAVIPALGHAYGEPGYIWADDNSTVTATIVCAHNAQHTIIETVDTQYAVITEPTEETAGEGQYTASFSSEFFTPQTKNVTLPAVGHIHRLTPVAAQAATCTEDGNVAYWVCDGCGLLFSDENGTQEISAEDVIVKAEGHKAAEAVQENVVSPTCETAGSHDNVVYCSVCNEELSRETVTDEAIGHEYGDWTYADADNHQKVCAHDASHVVTENHSWNDGEVTTEPTQTSEGVMTYTCTVCGGTKTESIPALTPSENAPVKLIWEHNAAEIRGIIGEEYILGEDFYEEGNKITVVYSDTSKNEVYICKDIDLGDDNVYTGYFLNGDTSGNYEEKDLCSHLDEEILTNGGKIVEGPNNTARIAVWFEDVTVYTDTFTVTGIEDPYSGPDEPEVDFGTPVSATFTLAEGNPVLTGEVGTNRADNFHESGNKFTVEYQKDGETQFIDYICVVEQESENSYVAGFYPNGDTKLDMYQLYPLVDEILVDGGGTLKAGNNSAKVRASFAHSEEEAAEEPVIYADITVYCEEEVHEHEAGTPVEENRVDPTCTREGSYDEVVYCSICGEEMSRETRTIPVNPDAHTPAEAVTENQVAPECDKEGGYDLVVYCVDCGEKISSEHVVLEALTHSWNAPTYEWVKDGEGYKVTAKRTCNNGNHPQTETVTATVKDKTDATYDAPGSVTYEALFTNEAFETQTKTDEIAQLVHTPEEALETAQNKNTEVDSQSADANNNAEAAINEADAINVDELSAEEAAAKIAEAEAKAKAAEEEAAAANEAADAAINAAQLALNLAQQAYGDSTDPAEQKALQDAKDAYAAATRIKAAASRSVASAKRATAKAAMKAAEAAQKAAESAAGEDAATAAQEAAEAAQKAADAAADAKEAAEAANTNAEAAAAAAQDASPEEQAKTEAENAAVEQVANDTASEEQAAQEAADAARKAAADAAVKADAEAKANDAAAKAAEAENKATVAKGAVSALEEAATAAKTAADKAAASLSQADIDAAKAATQTAKEKQTAAQNAIKAAQEAKAAADAAVQAANAAIAAAGDVDVSEAAATAAGAATKAAEADSTTEAAETAKEAADNNVTAAESTTDGAAARKAENDYQAAEAARRAEEQRAYEAWVAAENLRNGVYDPSIPKVKAKKPSTAKKGKITTKWTKLNKKKLKKSGVTHYEIWVSTDPSFPRGMTIEKTPKKTKSSLKITGLMKNTTYYVRVRGIKWIGATKYVGPWSQKTVKTKKK